jgi:hypothetical protein
MIVADCDPDNQHIFCRHCETPYKWQVHEKSGYRFLMPPPNTEVTEKVNDWGYA